MPALSPPAGGSSSVRELAAMKKATAADELDFACHAQAQEGEREGDLRAGDAALRIARRAGGSLHFGAGSKGEQVLVQTRIIGSGLANCSGTPIALPLPLRLAPALGLAAPHSGIDRGPRLPS